MVTAVSHQNIDPLPSEWAPLRHLKGTTANTWLASPSFFKYVVRWVGMA